MNARGSPSPDEDPTSLPRRRRLSLRNLRIKHRLPLLIGILLSGVITASIWASYRGVKESALEVGRERLLSLTQQLANQTQQLLPLALNRTAAVASDPAVRAFLNAPSSGTRAAAVSALQPFDAAHDPNSLRVDLWNANLTIALSVPDSTSSEPLDLSAEFEQSAVDPFKAVGSIRVIKADIVYPVLAAVKDDPGRVTGYLVRWRRITASPNARKQLADLLGSEASLYYGNIKGDTWTDLEKIVPAPPVSLGSTLEVTHYTRDGNSVMALGRPITGTPWFVVVEFPDRIFLIQANRFLRRILLIGFGLLLVGIVGALALTESITRPLHSLTKAASAISAGDHFRRVDINQKDELGALAGAFNAMVENAQHARREILRLNEELEQRVAERTAQLNAANKELEAFSYSVSHDLRAPLRHINGFSQALLEDYADKLDDGGKRYLQEVRNASQEMAQLIDDVLQMAKVTRTEMHREDVNLSELAGVVIAELQVTEVQKRNGRQSVAVNIQEGLTTHGDKRLLRIVLTNLLGNAWKFTSKRKQAEITFGSERHNDEVSYFVRDNGAGFDMAYTAKLFGAFQRLHGSSEFEGTGIGLATVQRIINRHGGRVWAEGAVNEGATFYFALPKIKEIEDGEQSDLIG